MSTPSPLCSLFRREGIEGHGAHWRTYVLLPDRRVDRHFYDSTYGGSTKAKAMARAWRSAMLALVTKPGLEGMALDRQIMKVQADFNDRRPHVIFVRVHVANFRGEPCRLRVLVTAFGQVTQRWESAVSFSLRLTFKEALGVVVTRVQQQIGVFFGAEVAQNFIAQHQKAFRASRFDPVTGIAIREPVDRYTSHGAK